MHHLVDCQPQNVAIHRWHPLDPPVRRMLGDPAVEFLDILHRAGNQPVDKRVGLRLGPALFGVQRIVIGGGGFLHGLPARIPQVEDLQRSLARPSAGCHYFAWRNCRIRFAISIAAMAASKPLLPLLAPARSMACSSVLQVSTPNATGTPLGGDVTDAFRRFPGYVIEMRRIAADHRAQANNRVVALLSRQFARHHRQFPGSRTFTTSISSGSPPVRASASRAPPSRRSLIKLLNRLTTMANCKPAAVS